ncbi:MAG: peptidyl-tRNA hydrolase Pth2 [Candidatus Nanoarchaeia archaeon]
MLKQVILLRQDLSISEGKAAAQAAHAALAAALNAKRQVLKAWLSEGAKKVVLAVKSERELLSYYKKAKAAKLPCALIADAGLTELKPGTKTALGIGPDEESKINKLTGNLPLY